MKVPLAAAAALLLGLAGCVTTNLTEAELSDPAIKARVEERLRAEPDLDMRFVNVDAHDKVVTLSGLVPMHRDRWKMERIAKSVPGVESVMVNLAVHE